MEFRREKYPLAHLIDIESIAYSLQEADSMLAKYQENVAIVNNGDGLDVMFLSSVRDRSSILEIVYIDKEHGYGR